MSAEIITTSHFVQCHVYYTSISHYHSQNVCSLMVTSNISGTSLLSTSEIRTTHLFNRDTVWFQGCP